MKDKGIVLWFTGMSGAGKSTISGQLAKGLIQKGVKTLVLDGDDVREKIHTHLLFTPEDILENNRLVAKLCLANIYDYDVILVPIISPYAIGRKYSREIIGKGFYEIYVQAPMDELIRRDTKGLYQKALKGKMDNLIGFSKKLPYEEPQSPDLSLNTHQSSLEENIQELTVHLDRWIKQ